MSAFSDNMAPDTKRAFIFSAALAGVAVVSALFAQPDVKAAAAQMRALADRL